MQGNIGLTSGDAEVVLSVIANVKVRSGSFFVDSKAFTTLAHAE